MNKMLSLFIISTPFLLIGMREEQGIKRTRMPVETAHSIRSAILDEESPAKQRKIDQKIPSLATLSAQAVSHYLETQDITSAYIEKLTAIQENLPWPVLPFLMKNCDTPQTALKALVHVSAPHILKRCFMPCTKYNLEIPLMDTEIRGSCSPEIGFRWNLATDRFEFFDTDQNELTFTNEYSVEHFPYGKNSQIKLNNLPPVILRESGSLTFYYETFAYDGSVLISSHDTEIRIWDTATGECIKRITGFKNAANKRCAISYNLSKLVIADDTGLMLIQLYDSSKLQCVRSLLDIDQMIAQLHDPEAEQPKTVIHAYILRFLYKQHKSLHICQNPELKKWFYELSDDMQSYVRLFLPACPSDCHDWWKIFGKYNNLCIAYKIPSRNA